MRFPTLSPSELDTILSAEAPGANTDDRHAAIAAAAGSPGAALAFLDMDLAKPAKVMRMLRDNGDRDFSLRGELSTLIGNRPDRERMRAVLDLSRAVLLEGVEVASRAGAQARVASHVGLIALTNEFVTYNFDAGLLAIEIGNLLASAAEASEPADG